MYDHSYLISVLNHNFYKFSVSLYLNISIFILLAFTFGKITAIDLYQHLLLIGLFLVIASLVLQKGY